MSSKLNVWGTLTFPSNAQQAWRNTELDGGAPEVESEYGNSFTQGGSEEVTPALNPTPRALLAPFARPRRAPDCTAHTRSRNSAATAPVAR